MGAARILIICVAFVAAIGLALVVRGMMIGKPVKAVPLSVAQASAPPPLALVRVLVAKHDLGVGDHITADDMTWQSMPKQGVNPNYITDGAVAAATTTTQKVTSAGVQMVKDAVSGQPAAMDSLIGSVVHEAISAGEPILVSKLIKEGEGGYLSAVLDPGMRAVSISLSAENGAGGFILPGDHVDVIQVTDQDNPAGGKAIQVARTVVTNVRVLAIDQKTRPDKDAQAIVGAAATLEVNNDAAQAIIEAGASGKLQLALRSFSDAAGPSDRVAARVPVAPVVKLYENGKITDVMVTP